MLDCISMVANTEPMYPYNSTKSFIWRGLWFNPAFIRGAENIKGFESEFKGLRIFLEYTKIKISNSLHKFYKGDNYSDFTFSEMAKAIDEVCNKFEIPANEWVIKKLEFGFNIITQKPAKEYLLCFHSFKEKEFDKMKKGGKKYGMKCSLTEYFIKFYDKSLEYKLHERIIIDENILRVEIGYNNKRKLPEKIQTLADLKVTSNIDTLYNELINIVRIIYYQEEKNFTNTAFDERVLFFASEHKNFLEVEKKENKNQLKTTKKKIKQIREKVLKKDFVEFLQKSLKDKYIQLFCS
ncbi:MAG: hypothetical protein IPK18_03485 [Sphingobacteriales bacterium]|nr:MAG: hypothetical protein IPK18_03485 [Sphingobacteriales bacterium]